MAGLDPRVQARALAGTLARLGFGARVRGLRGDRHPCVEVAGCRPGCVHTTEYVYAVPADPFDEEGPWEFRWSFFELVGPVGDVVAAAAQVARRLPCFAGPCPECAGPGEAS